MFIWEKWPSLFRNLDLVLAQIDRKRKFLEQLDQGQCGRTERSALVANDVPGHRLPLNSPFCGQPPFDLGNPGIEREVSGNFDEPIRVSFIETGPKRFGD